MLLDKTVLWNLTLLSVRNYGKIDGISKSEQHVGAPWDRDYLVGSREYGSQEPVAFLGGIGGCGQRADSWSLVGIVPVYAQRRIYVYPQNCRWCGISVLKKAPENQEGCVYPWLLWICWSIFYTVLAHAARRPWVVTEKIVLDAPSLRS